MRTQPSESSKTNEREENSKNVRMSLHVLQPAATDKENLVGPGRNAVAPENSKSVGGNEKKKIETLPKSSLKKKKVMKVTGGESSKRTVTASDLMNEEPSETYWEVLAEKRRVALDDALAENEALTERITLLEQENAVSQEMLNEARSLIDVLKELIGGNDSVEDVAEDDDDDDDDDDDENVGHN